LLYKKVDNALYLAKERGRYRIEKCDLIDSFSYDFALEHHTLRLDGNIETKEGF